MPLHRRRHRLRHGLLPPRVPQRPLPQKAHPDLLSLPQPAGRRRRGGAAVQLAADAEAPHAQRRRRRRPRQHRAQSDRHREAPRRKPIGGADQSGKSSSHRRLLTDAFSQTPPHTLLLSDASSLTPPHTRLLTHASSHTPGPCPIRHTHTHTPCVPTYHAPSFFDSTSSSSRR